MNLLNIVLLAGVISVNGSWACTPPEECCSRSFTGYEIRSYASEFPGSAQSDLKFLEILNAKKQPTATTDSRPNPDAKKQEIVASVVKRSSSGSPRNSMCMITNTNTLSSRITRQLAPVYSPEE
jgi:hypothetical protein